MLETIKTIIGKILAKLCSKLLAWCVTASTVENCTSVEPKKTETTEEVAAVQEETPAAQEETKAEQTEVEKPKRKRAPRKTKAKAE